MAEHEIKKGENTNTGFLFGLALGAAVGALSAVLINKNGEKEVIKNFESKIRDFFQDLVGDIKTKKENISKKIEFIDVKPEPEEPKKPPVIIHRKITPKMFVKRKK